MIKPKIFDMMLFVAAAIMAVTTISSQNAIASIIGVGDIDVEETVEAENATMSGAQTRLLLTEI
jgi:cell division protein FtsL